MERALEILSKSGKKYKFIEFKIFNTVVNAYCWYSNKWNRLTTSFNSLEEAKEWINDLDRKYEAFKEAPKESYNVPSDYYGRAGVYYGD